MYICDTLFFFGCKNIKKNKHEKVLGINNLSNFDMYYIFAP